MSRREERKEQLAKIRSNETDKLKHMGKDFITSKNDEIIEK
jgi:hypothetical protein